MSKPIKTVVLFSGGKESMLAACKCAAEHRQVTPLSCQPGTLRGENALAWAAERLQGRFGQNLIQPAEIVTSSSTKARIASTWTQTSWGSLGNCYPNLTNCQIQCLHCQTAMWVCAIAYAKAKNIKNIAAGYKATDDFCTGMKPYADYMAKLAGRFAIHIDLPVWDLKDEDRDTQLEWYGLSPAILEPSCVIGEPPRTPMSNAAEHELMLYLDNEIGLERLMSYTNLLIPAYKTIKTGHTPENMYKTKPNFGDA